MPDGQRGRVRPEDAGQVRGQGVPQHLRRQPGPGERRGQGTGQKAGGGAQGPAGRPEGRPGGQGEGGKALLSAEVPRGVHHHRRDDLHGDGESLKRHARPGEDQGPAGAGGKPGAPGVPEAGGPERQRPGAVEALRRAPSTTRPCWWRASPWRTRRTSPRSSARSCDGNRATRKGYRYGPIPLQQLAAPGGPAPCAPRRAGPAPLRPGPLLRAAPLRGRPLWPCPGPAGPGRLAGPAAPGGAQPIPSPIHHPTPPLFTRRRPTPWAAPGGTPWSRGQAAP